MATETVALPSTASPAIGGLADRVQDPTSNNSMSDGDSDADGVIVSSEADGSETGQAAIGLQNLSQSGQKPPLSRHPEQASTAESPPGCQVADAASGSAAAASALNKDEIGWRRIVRNFTPSWFSVNMGTGIVSILLYNLPYNVSWVQYIAITIFLLNVCLFTFFMTITLVRYILYPEIWSVMIRHRMQSLFLGCIPMGLATIVNMTVFVCAPWGNWAIYMAWALWWVDVGLSCACSLSLPFIVVHHHKNQLSNLTGALLLPVVPVVVAAASGGIVAEVLPNRAHASTTMVVSYAMWGLGQMFAFFIMSGYFLRLLVHDLPPREVIVSVFLPVGPLGQGGFAIQQLGRVALKLLPPTGAFSDDTFANTSGIAIGTATATATGSSAAIAQAMNAGVVLYVLGILGALALWGAALGWLVFAVFSIMSTKSFPFNMGWWGFTFPLGVFTTCTTLMATELSSPFLKILSMFFSSCVVFFWSIVAYKTVSKALTGEIFHAPCLRDLRPKTAQADGDRTV